MLAALSGLAGRDFDEQAGPPAPVAPARPAAAGGEHTLAGLSGAPGIASGLARHFKAPEPEIPTSPAGKPEAEWEALT